MDRLRQRADFLAVANGTRANSAAFVVQGRRRLRELVKRLDVISMRPHHDYVLVGRRAALTRDFATMLDDLRSALHRLDRQPKPFGGTKAVSSEVDTGSREEKRVQTKSEGLESDVSRNRKDPQSELNGETPER